MRIQINTILKYIFVFIAIYISVSPFMKNEDTYAVLLVGFTISAVFLLFVISKGIIQKLQFLRILGCLAIFIMLMLLAALINGDSYLNSYIAIILKLVITGCMVLCLGFEEYKKIYIHWMVFLSIVSLISMGWILTAPESIESFTFGYQNTGSYTYCNAGIYVFMRSRFFKTYLVRNNGICWEPGVWQGCINIALMLLLKDLSRQNAKKAVLVIVLFLITLITTGSVAGYLILIGVLWVNRDKLMHLVSSKKSLANLFLLLIGAMLIFLFITSRYDIRDITVRTDYYSNSNNFMDRLDLEDGRYLFTNPGHSLVGYSLQSELFTHGHSNGIIAYWIAFGTLFIIFYYYLLYNSLKTTMENPIGWILVLSLINTNEVLLLQPLMVYFIFYGVGNKKNRTLKRIS